MSPAPETLVDPRLRDAADLARLQMLAARFQSAEEEEFQRRSALYRSVAPSPTASSGTQDSVRPVLLHKVFNLCCTHCKTFFTDRGMRAILLLRPSVVLFSTDLAPINMGSLPPSGDESERTCQCLSQSMGCYHCGNTVGYHIVTPCEQCTGTSTASQRTANGHRYVFHAGQVDAVERRFTADDAELSSQPHIALRSSTRSRGRASSLVKSSAPPIRSVSPYLLPSARAGDQVYWIHLQQGGEAVIPIDPATRPSRWPQAGR